MLRRLNINYFHGLMSAGFILIIFSVVFGDNTGAILKSAGAAAVGIGGMFIIINNYPSTKK